MPIRNGERDRASSLPTGQHVAPERACINMEPARGFPERCSSKVGVTSFLQCFSRCHCHVASRIVFQVRQCLVCLRGLHDQVWAHSLEKVSHRFPLADNYMVSRQPMAMLWRHMLHQAVDVMSHQEIPDSVKDGIGATTLNDDTRYCGRPITTANHNAAFTIKETCDIGPVHPWCGYSHA